MARRAPQPDDPLRLDFGPMRAKRRAMEMSQLTLSRAAGVHRNQVSYWESGQRIPSALELAYVARTLGTPQWMLYDVVDAEGNSVSDPWVGKRR